MDLQLRRTNLRIDKVPIPDIVILVNYVLRFQGSRD